MVHNNNNSNSPGDTTNPYPYPQTPPEGRPNTLFPYPRWFTMATRGCLAILATVTLAFTAWLMATNRSEIRAALFMGTILSCSGSILVNYFATILSYLNKYGPGGYWLWVVFADPIIGGCGIWGFVVGTESREGSNTEGWSWKGSADAVAYLSLVLGVAHLLANVGGFYGIRLVNRRKREMDEEIRLGEELRGRRVEGHV